MPDLPSELRRSMSRLVSRVQDSWQAAHGVELPSAQRLPGNPTAATGVLETAPDTFATGYDAGTGETTMVFTLDFSLFDSADTLG